MHESTSRLVPILHLSIAQWEAPTKRPLLLRYCLVAEGTSQELREDNKWLSDGHLDVSSVQCEFDTDGVDYAIDADVAARVL